MDNDLEWPYRVSDARLLVCTIVYSAMVHIQPHGKLSFRPVKCMYKIMHLFFFMIMLVSQKVGQYVSQYFDLLDLLLCGLLLLFLLFFLLLLGDLNYD